MTTSPTSAPTDRPTPMHPTRARLLDTTVELLDSVPVDQVTSAMVLERSGVSHGSLYHHYADFPDLVQHAVCHRFVRTVARDVEQLGEVLLAATDAADFRARMVSAVVETHRAGRRPNRLERIQAIAASVGRPRFEAALAAEQQAVTDRLRDVVVTAQHRGWARPDVDAGVLAVLFQALTLGRTVDDVAARPVDPDAWTATLVQIVEFIALA